jgi:uncharacterized protein
LRFANSYNERVLKLNSLDRIRGAAKTGDPFAQFELALSLAYGTEGRQDFGRASDWYAKAAHQGHQAANNNLLLQHVLGQARSRQPKMVFSELKEFAESGDYGAQNNLGLCYQSGYGTTVDYKRAAVWYRRAARSGSAEAQFNLGGYYFEGKGLRKDLRRAFAWYTKSAEQLHELALIQLGCMYQKGLGIAPDLHRALVLYLIAYRRGSARAANHLASMFRRGLGVRRDLSLAYSLYLQSVERPDTCDAAEQPSYRRTAYFYMGSMAKNGQGISPSLEIAKKWYRLGAALGDSDCVNELTRLRRRGPRAAAKE